MCVCVVWLMAVTLSVLVCWWGGDGYYHRSPSDPGSSRLVPSSLSVECGVAVIVLLAEVRFGWLLRYFRGFGFGGKVRHFFCIKQFYLRKSLFYLRIFCFLREKSK